LKETKNLFDNVFVYPATGTYKVKFLDFFLSRSNIDEIRIFPCRTHNAEYDYTAPEFIRHRWSMLSTAEIRHLEDCQVKCCETELNQNFADITNRIQKFQIRLVCWIPN